MGWLDWLSRILERKIGKLERRIARKKQKEKRPTQSIQLDEIRVPVRDTARITALTRRVGRLKMIQKGLRRLRG